MSPADIPDFTPSVTSVQDISALLSNRPWPGKREDWTISIVQLLAEVTSRDLNRTYTIIKWRMLSGVGKPRIPVCLHLLP